MRKMVKGYLTFLYRSLSLAFVGDWRYYLWVGFLTIVCLLGLNAYAKQFVHGLVITGMTDQVSWGVYIANFTFLVGVAAAAVMLVIPVYIYKNEDLHDLVIFGELLAVAAILMCLGFVTVDLGRPDRFWHLIPGIGKFNFPGSMLSWDVIVLNGYLLLNVHICGYLLYCRYQRKTPAKWFYIPFVFIAIVWAISIHTVTAFLYVGLGGRPFWNSSIVGPRFLASAFTAGPALIILAIQVVRRVTANVPAGQMTWRFNGTTAPKASVKRPATTDDLNLLAFHLPQLVSVSAATRQAILPKLSVVDVAAGEVVLCQGDTDNEAYLVLKGRIVVEREESGRRRVTRSCGPGEQFGEVSALAGTPREATAIAEEPSQVLRVPTDALRDLMKYPELKKTIRARMAERLMITDRALLTLRSVVQISMVINVFLLFNELFKEFYTDNVHVASSKYLYFGLHGHHALNVWIWTAIACNLVALKLLLLPLSRSLRWLNLACVLAIVGIWIEKGMGLVIPGFIPTPLGEIVEYSPTVNETLICFGIWAFGLLCYTLFLRVSIPILQGTISKANEPGSDLKGSEEQLEALLQSSVPRRFTAESSRESVPHVETTHH
ncbi:MAG: polysulfide reductase NrfD [Verrucomicrobia bacterium]|nr:polysulfide reductase NrfD [Verrucomicrobiota bacterium]